MEDHYGEYYIDYVSNKSYNIYMKLENAMQEADFYGNGIPYEDGWSMIDIEKITRYRLGFWIDSVYDYDEINFQTKDLLLGHKDMNDRNRISDMDPFLWEEFTEKIEESRQFMIDTCMSYGINEEEAHFLSVKFAASIISKFRLQMFIQFGGKDAKQEFQATHLRNAINVLWYRFKHMQVFDRYLFSKEAANDQIDDFRKQAAIETARMLVDETGAILHAKLTM